MDTFGLESNKMELSDEVKRRISLILQGTNDGPGIGIKHLKFTSNPAEIDKEIALFIDLVNKRFAGILQLVRSGDFIVPIIINKDAVEKQRRSIPGKAIALAAIILLHEFVNHQGPTLANLEQKFQVTNIETREITKLISILKDLRWVDEVEDAGVICYNPTPALKACISPEMLLRVYSEIYNIAANEEEKALFLNFLPKEYIKERRALKFTQTTLGIPVPAKKESDPEDGEHSPD